MWGYGGSDTIYGNAHADQIYGGDGHDRLYGQNGYDSIFGETGQDTIYGGNGHDKLWGESPEYACPTGPNVIYGGEGNDEIMEGCRAGWAYGEGGFDLIHCDPNDATIADGGPEYDSCATSGDPDDPNNWLGDCCSNSCIDSYVNCYLVP
jgi:Ca2+-binding RTX toxin-like protein